MTTIAFDGKVLAADRRVTDLDTNTIVGKMVKIRPVGDGRYLAMCGTACIADRFMAWVTGGLQGDPPAGRYDALLVGPGNRVSEFEYDDTNGSWGWIEWKAPLGLGSGGQYALAAMYAGKGAKEAVEIACKIDIYSGGPIDSVELQRPLSKTRKRGEPVE